jgi:hypothetical protein
MKKTLISHSIRVVASNLILKLSEVNYPAINIPIYQDRENSPEDNAGGAFGISTPYIDNLSVTPFNDPKQSFPVNYADQGERPENDADFYTSQYASDSGKVMEVIIKNSAPKNIVESPKDGYKGPGYQETFTHGRGDINPAELYPDYQQGGDLQL